MTHVFPLIALHKIFYNSFFKKIAICTFFNNIFYSLELSGCILTRLYKLLACVQNE